MILNILFTLNTLKLKKISYLYIDKFNEYYK